MQVREESWVEDRGGAMKLDSNCQLCFNSDFVCIPQQNKEGVMEVEGVCEWGERERKVKVDNSIQSQLTLSCERGRQGQMKAKVGETGVEK